MSQHTPGPWVVKFREHRHRKGSPACRERCVNGAVPLRVEQDTEARAARIGCPGELELHVFLIDHVEDVIAADGTHVVCMGHDYDDYGFVCPDNARLIAAAPDLLAALKAAVAWMNERRELAEIVEPILLAGNAIAKAEQESGPRAQYTRP